MNPFTRIVKFFKNDYEIETCDDDEITEVFNRNALLLNDDVQDSELTPALPAVDPGLIAWCEYLDRSGKMR